MMNINNFVLLSYILLVIGLLTSVYLYLADVSIVPLGCTLSSCEKVNTSEYAYFFGIPLALFGVVFYLGTIIVLYLKKYNLFFLAGIIGLLTSIYLTSVEAFILHAFCQWCLLSAWVTVCIFILSFKMKNFGRD